jgi:hypothetical protein
MRNQPHFVQKTFLEVNDFEFCEENRFGELIQLAFSPWRKTSQSMRLDEGEVHYLVQHSQGVGVINSRV